MFLFFDLWPLNASVGFFQISQIHNNLVASGHINKIVRASSSPWDRHNFKLIPSSQLQIVGSRATICGLKMMQEMMELAMECRKNDPEAVGLYEKPIADIKEAIKKLEKAKKASQ